MENYRALWLRLFDDQGWFRGGKPGPPEVLEQIGICYGSEEETFLGLQYVVEVTDDFLVMEYSYEAPPIQIPWTVRHPSGKTKKWIPWSSIKYAYENSHSG